jgi:hypothetical protein
VFFIVGTPDLAWRRKIWRKLRNASSMEVASLASGENGSLSMQFRNTPCRIPAPAWTIQPVAKAAHRVE